MKATILIIEDVKEMSDLVSLYLSKEGMTVISVDSAELALEKLKTILPDLILLDLNLPGMDGFEFLNVLRKQSSVPVLIVSARDADEDIISGLGCGADEFITKPFSPRVLVARVRAIVRRTQESLMLDNEKIYTFGPFSLYTSACVLKKGQQQIRLSAKEYGVLLFLATNSGKTLTPEVIYKEVWNNAYGDLTAVAVYIQRLRKKIEDDPTKPQYIETVYGMGYRLDTGNTGAL